jgi:hypothetical protein
MVRIYGIIMFFARRGKEIGRGDVWGRTRYGTTIIDVVVSTILNFYGKQLPRWVSTLYICHRYETHTNTRFEFLIFEYVRDLDGFLGTIAIALQQRRNLVLLSSHLE